MLKLLLYVFSISMVGGREIDYIKPPQSVLTKLFEISFNCIKETNVDAETVNKLITWSFKNTASVRKFLFCFLNKAKYADDDGHYIVQNIVPLLGHNKKKDEFESVLKECNKLEGKDKYDTLFKIYTCTHDKTPILFSI